MELDVDKFIIAYPLANHPVLSATKAYKVEYLTALYYLVLKYSKNKETAIAQFENYQKVFLDKETIDFSKTKTLSQVAVKTVMGYKFKGFKRFTYRYVLLCDAFFLSAFADEETAQAITDEVKTLFRALSYRKIEQLFAVLYQDGSKLKGLDLMAYPLECWRQNKAFSKKPQKRILITGNMSAGKSTLINAVIGKRVNRTMNAVCTQKKHYIYDKAFEDGYTHKWDYEINFNADEARLMEDDKRSVDDKLCVATSFAMLEEKNQRLCIIDTPGVNSVQHEHGELSRDCIAKEMYDLLICVVNVEGMGTCDEYQQLVYVSKNAPKEKVIFVLNKIDVFRLDEDSIDENVADLKKDLLANGFEQPRIYPISSYAGILAKKKMLGQELTAEEIDDMTWMKKKFAMPEWDLLRFYPDLGLESMVNQADEDTQFMIRSGLLGLQKILMQRS